MNRSEIMSRIRGKGNLSTERRMIEIFRKYRIIGWRRHQTILKPGGGLRYVRPDFTFPRARVLVLVDGCFWHACQSCYRRPKSNLEYWIPKMRANKKRDVLATATLSSNGWRVFRIWEHCLKSSDEGRAKELARQIAAVKAAVRRTRRTKSRVK